MNELILSEFKKYIDYVKLEYLYSVLQENDKEIKTQTQRLRVVKNVYNILKNYDKEITSGKQVANLEGIGKKTVDRIDEILKTGKIKIETHKMPKELKSLAELIQVHGIGYKKAMELVKKYKIGSIEELKKSKIKLSDQIKLGLKYHGVVEEVIPREVIDKIYDYLKKFSDNLYIAGSYRRGKATSGDIDVLIFEESDILERLEEDGFIVDSLTDLDVKKYMGYCKFKGKYYRIDVRFFDDISAPTALLYFTGPKELNTFMRKKAKAMGLLLNEYGLYKDKKHIKVESEKDVFKELGMKYLKPIERENYIEKI